MSGIKKMKKEINDGQVITFIYSYCDRLLACYRIAKTANPKTKKDAYKWLLKLNKKIEGLERMVYGKK